MFTDEESVTPEISRESSRFEGPDSDAMLPENIADGLRVLKRERFQPTATAARQGEIPKLMFVLFRMGTRLTGWLYLRPTRPNRRRSSRAQNWKSKPVI